MKKLSFFLALVLMLLSVAAAIPVSAAAQATLPEPVVKFDFSDLTGFTTSDVTVENGVATVGMGATSSTQKGKLSTTEVSAVKNCTDITVFTAVKLSDNTDTWITLLALGDGTNTLVRIMAKNSTIYAQYSTGTTNLTESYNFTPDQWVWLTCVLDYTGNTLNLSLYASMDMGKTWESPKTAAVSSASIKPASVSMLCSGKGVSSSAAAEADYPYYLDDIRIYGEALTLDQIKEIALSPIENLHVQTKQGSAANKMDARLLATVDSLGLTDVGFDVSITYVESGQEKAKALTHTATTVYDSVLAEGEPVTAQELGGKYLVALAIKDIPADVNAVLSVKAFATENSIRSYTHEHTVSLATLKGYSYWSLDDIGQNGNLTDTAGGKNATAANCTVASDAVKGASVLLEPANGSNIGFGTTMTDTLKNNGVMTVAFWYFPKTEMLHRNTLLQLSTEGGDEGVSVRVKGNTLTVTCRKSNGSGAVEKEYTYQNTTFAEWLHFAITLDYTNGTVEVYRNGTALSARSGGNSLGFSGTYAPGTPMYEDVIGGVTDTYLKAYLFSGRVDEVYLYPRALSATEINGLYSQKSSESEAEKQKRLYAALRTLTSANGGNTVLSVGSNVVLACEDRRSLVPGNTAPAVFKEGSTCYAPAAFFEAYYASAYASVSVSISDTKVKDGVTYWSVQEFALGASVNCMTVGDQIILGSKNASAELQAFIADYYAGNLETLPVPEQDVYSTRVEIQSGTKLASPSIAKLSNGNLVASYDYQSGSTWYTAVEVSTDGGKTWTQKATVQNLNWATLFCLNDVLYLMGTQITSTANREKVAIAKSTDGGTTWSSLSTVDSTVQQAHHAPTPAVVSGGRIYIAFEERINESGNNVGMAGYRAYMMSADVTADLTAASNWTRSSLVKIDPGEFSSNGYYGGSNSGFGICEGNAVAGPDGMYIIARISSEPTSGLAYVMKLSADNTTLSFHKIINLPVGTDKFVIRYDASTQKYIAIGNDKHTGSYPNQRNVLSMYWSTDLETWNYGATLISDNTLNMPEYTAAYYGYQYPDFILDGEDILMVVREASGTTTYFHDANYITFYTVKNYKQFLQK